MEKTLFDREGRPVAYLTEDYERTIYLWEGEPAAYLYEERHVYGMNGRHLGWFVGEIVYNHDGARVGFTHGTCPVPVTRESAKWKKRQRPQTRPRWASPPFPERGFEPAPQGLADFLSTGRVPGLGGEVSGEASPDSEG